MAWLASGALSPACLSDPSHSLAHDVLRAAGPRSHKGQAHRAYLPSKPPHWAFLPRSPSQQQFRGLGIIRVANATAMPFRPSYGTTHRATRATAIASLGSTAVAVATTTMLALPVVAQFAPISAILLARRISAARVVQ